jgi:peroxiredoxin-like protein
MVHHYHARCSWKGSTGAGYESYGRDHTAGCAPARDQLVLSGDTAFGGNGDRLNPEQLLVAAASSCQLLSFLAVAARARIDVIAYEDHAEAEMPEEDLPVRMREIVLRPFIRLHRGPDAARVQKLVELAHRECYVANSLKTEVRVEARLEFV